MNKVSTKYVDEIGLQVDINYASRNITINPSHGNPREKGFVFIGSKEETIRKIGESFIRIADLAKKEFPKIKHVKQNSKENK